MDYVHIVKHDAHEPKGMENNTRCETKVKPHTFKDHFGYLLLVRKKLFHFPGNLAWFSVSHQEGNRNAHSCPDPESESGLLPGCYMLTKRRWKSKGRKQNPIERAQPSCKLGA